MVLIFAGLEFLTALLLKVPFFQAVLLCPTSGSRHFEESHCLLELLTWRWRQYDPSKCRKNAPTRIVSQSWSTDSSSYFHLHNTLCSFLVALLQQFIFGGRKTWLYSQIKSHKFSASVTLASFAKWIKVYCCTEPQAKQDLLLPSEIRKLKSKQVGWQGNNSEQERLSSNLSHVDAHSS